ncbi:MAG: NUDIX hydrolase [Salinisphaera sp.]|jgi:ADP-ribose pyrophosphatase|nr:NUDIX hydrolase [Salinisphaera sp.]
MSNEAILFEGDYLRLRRRGTWEYAERVNARGAVVIVAVTPDNELLLVEQPRAPMGGPVLELPAGLVGDIQGEENEDMAVAAGRELEEETGYRAARFEFLTAGPPSAGLAGEVLSFYRAIELTRVGAGGGDETEEITVYAVPLGEIEPWLQDKRDAGVWVDPKIYTGLYFIQRDQG